MHCQQQESCVPTIQEQQEEDVTTRDEEEEEQDRMDIVHNHHSIFDSNEEGFESTPGFIDSHDESKAYSFNSFFISCPFIPLRLIEILLCADI